MIETKLEKYLQSINRATLRADFVPQSLARIISMPQEAARQTLRERLWESVTTGSALALSSLLLVIVLGGISYLSHRSAGTVAVSGGLSDDQLVREASQFTFQVQIHEAQLFDESAQKVALILDTLTKDSMQ